MNSITRHFTRPVFTLMGCLALTLTNSGFTQAAEPKPAPNAPARRPELRGEQNLGPFSLLDTDHDGTLSKVEIAAAAQVLSQFDKNHDGTLTASELPQRRPPPPRDRNLDANDEANEPPMPSPDSPARRPALLGEQNLGPIALFDTDQDGILSKEELAAAAQVLSQFDKNHDGTLTASELPQRRPPPPRDRNPDANDEAHEPPMP